MNTVIYMTGVGMAAIFCAALARRKKFVVPEGHYGLLYCRGRYRHRISPGKHRFWKTGYSVRMVDMRKLSLEVAGAEVLSKEKVAVRINALLIYQIIQAETVFHDVQDYVASLNHAVQSALDAVISATPMDILLSSRLDIGGELCALVMPEADKIGVVVHAVEVKEVMVIGGLKRLTGTSAT